MLEQGGEMSVERPTTPQVRSNSMIQDDTGIQAPTHAHKTSPGSTFARPCLHVPCFACGCWALRPRNFPAQPRPPACSPRYSGGFLCVYRIQWPAPGVLGWWSHFGSIWWVCWCMERWSARAARFRWAAGAQHLAHTPNLPFHPLSLVRSLC
jgi:hypothetical protein